MKKLLLIVFGWVLAITQLPAQSVSSINFNYLYNLTAEVDLQFGIINHPDKIEVSYVVTSGDPLAQFKIQWEKKDSYDQKLGGIIQPFDSVKLKNGMTKGGFMFDKIDKPWVLVAHIQNTKTGKKWFFTKQIESHYPTNGYLEKDGERVFQNFVIASDHFIVRGSGSEKPIRFSFYHENFPTPSPPFAEQEYKMDRFLFPDSIFTILPGEKIGPFKLEGLYLGQEDTLSNEGFSFLVKNAPYPRYNKLADLKGPLLFVTTKDENDHIGAAGEDKAKFDKVILDITNDKDRARSFMRSYFKRVEYANLFFTSFKEGWKTDRGMIFIVYGAPDQITIRGQQEIWDYHSIDQEFYFNKVGSVYSPDYYVLVRDKKSTEYWYLTVDQWRKGRF